MLCGIKCPGFKREGDSDIPEPFAEEARFFTEARLLQRDVKVRLEGVSSQNAVGTVLHPVRPTAVASLACTSEPDTPLSSLQNGNIAERLVREGLARCVDWSIRLLTSGREVLRVAEKEAKEKRLRIWKVGQLPPPPPPCRPWGPADVMQAPPSPPRSTSPQRCSCLSARRSLWHEWWRWSTLTHLSCGCLPLANIRRSSFPVSVPPGV